MYLYIIYMSYRHLLPPLGLTRVYETDSRGRTVAEG